MKYLSLLFFIILNLSACDAKVHAAVQNKTKDVRYCFYELNIEKATDRDSAHETALSLSFSISDDIHYKGIDAIEPFGLGYSLYLGGGCNYLYDQIKDLSGNYFTIKVLSEEDYIEAMKRDTNWLDDPKN